jgi:hypothetical protein
LFPALRRLPARETNPTEGIQNEIETVESAAKRLTANMQPVLEFNAAANVKTPEPPAKTPLPAALAKALGQS